jgi:hypothetical protein
MSHDDRRLSAALAALPRTPAAPGFAARVMRRVAAEREAPVAAFRPRRLSLAAAALLVLAVTTLAVQELRHRAAERGAASEIAALEAEYESLARELAALEARAAAARPLMPLATNDDVELVLDVASFARRDARRSRFPEPPPRPIY